MFGNLSVTPTSNYSQPETDVMSFEKQHGETFYPISCSAAGHSADCHISPSASDKSNQSHFLHTFQSLPGSAQNAFYRAQQIRNQTRPGTWFIDVTAQPSTIVYDEIEFSSIPDLIGTAVITLGVPEPEDGLWNGAFLTSESVTDRRRDLLTKIIEMTNCDDPLESKQETDENASVVIGNPSPGSAQDPLPASSSFSDPASANTSASNDEESSNPHLSETMTDDAAFMNKLFQSPGIPQHPHPLAIWLDRMQSNTEYFGQPPYQLWVLDVEFHEPTIEDVQCSLPARRVYYKVESRREEQTGTDKIAIVYLTCSNAAADGPPPPTHARQSRRDHRLQRRRPQRWDWHERILQARKEEYDSSKVASQPIVSNFPGILLPPLSVNALPTDRQTPMDAEMYETGTLDSLDSGSGSEYFHSPSPSPTDLSPLKMTLFSSSLNPLPATPLSTACSCNPPIYRVNRSMSIPTGSIGVSIDEDDPCAQLAYTTPDRSFSSIHTAQMDWDEEMRAKGERNGHRLYADVGTGIFHSSNGLRGLGLHTDDSPTSEPWRSMNSFTSREPFAEELGMPDDPGTATPDAWIGYPAHDSRSPSIRPKQSSMPDATLHNSLILSFIDTQLCNSNAYTMGDPGCVELTDQMPFFSLEDSESDTSEHSCSSPVLEDVSEDLSEVSSPNGEIPDSEQSDPSLGGENVVNRWDNPFGKECIVARKRTYSSSLQEEEQRKRLEKPNVSNQKNASLQNQNDINFYPTHENQNLPLHPFVIHSPCSSLYLHDRQQYHQQGPDHHCEGSNLDIYPFPWQTPRSRPDTERTSPVPLGPMRYDDLCEGCLMRHLKECLVEGIGHGCQIACEDSDSVQRRWNFREGIVNDPDQLGDEGCDGVGSVWTSKVKGEEEDDEANSEETESCEDCQEEYDEEAEEGYEDEEGEEEEEEEEGEEEENEIEGDEGEESDEIGSEAEGNRGNQDEEYDKNAVEMEECLVLNTESFESLCAWFGYFPSPSKPHIPD